MQRSMILIISDQHTAGVLEIEGNSVVQAPYLDELAQQGTYFPSAYCNSPICVPSRASVATGRPVHELGTWDNSIAYTGNEAESWGHRLVQSAMPVTTIGKLHFRLIDDPTGYPDQRLPLHIRDGVGDVQALLRDALPPRSSRSQALAADVGRSSYNDYDDQIASEAVRWLSQEAPKHDRPWVLFVSFVAPHQPLVVPEEYANRHKIDDIPMPEDSEPEDWPMHATVAERRQLQGIEEPLSETEIRRARWIYYGLVSYLDDRIGRIVNTLHDSGLAETTDLLYTSDHGTHLGEHGLWWKGSMYEESVRVPLIHYPRIEDRTEVDVPVSHLDIFPSILATTGATPRPDDNDLRGTSLREVGENADQLSDRVAFSEYHSLYAARGQFMIRRRNLKYIHTPGYPPQLFDLDQDPAERNDLSEARGQDITELEAALREWVDPERVDETARREQSRRVEALGGRRALLEDFEAIDFSPPPTATEE